MKNYLTLMASASLLALSGCAALSGYTGEREPVVVDMPPPAPETVVEVEKEVEVVVEVEAEPTNAERLQAILDSQPDEVKARYDARHPADTIAFFEVEPGTVVVEALPGGGWYTKILMPYIGSGGALVGAQYPDDLWPKILPNLSEEGLATRVANSAGWADRAKEWVGEDGPKVKSYYMSGMEDGHEGHVDTALFIRALHNLNRADEDLSTIKATLAETYTLLKPGGIVGVVQHRAPETNSDEWADGSSGYLKQSHVIALFEEAGFELVATSEINANAKDVPTEEDFVWRLPPTRARTEEGTPERAAVDAIGESDRMTLKFRKPVTETVADVVEETVVEAVEAVEAAVDEAS